MICELLFAPSIQPGQEWLVKAMGVLLAMLVGLVGFMLIYLITRRRIERIRERYRTIHRELIQRAIFSEPAEGGPRVIPIPLTVARSLRIPVSRQAMIAELMCGKKSLSGAAAANLVLLYRQLGLERDSLRKLTSKKWHLQAQGIQELAIMEQREYVRRLYRLTNSHDEVVRREAQAAIVQLYGFDGLRFLDVIDTPLSEWQQMQLLRLLQHAVGTPQEKVLSWLRSPNETVRIFALKLIAEQHLPDMLSGAEGCLRDRSEEVRLQAIRCMRDLGAGDSCPALIRTYPDEGLQGKLAILDALGRIGTAAVAGLLEAELSACPDRLKLEAARALVRIGPDGQMRLDQFSLRGRSPWDEIIRQAKTEQLT